MGVGCWMKLACLSALLAVVTLGCGGEEGGGPDTGGAAGGGQTSSGGGTAGSRSSGGAPAAGGSGTGGAGFDASALAETYCRELHSAAASGGCEPSLDAEDMCVSATTVLLTTDWSAECSALYRVMLECRLAEGSLACEPDGATWVGCETETAALDPCWM